MKPFDLTILVMTRGHGKMIERTVTLKGRGKDILETMLVLKIVAHGYDVKIMRGA